MKSAVLFAALCCTARVGAAAADDIPTSLAAHDRAVPIHNQWIRDPFVLLAVNFTADGDVVILAEDPAYASPGPEEDLQFND